MAGSAGKMCTMPKGEFPAYLVFNKEGYPNANDERTKQWVLQQARSWNVNEHDLPRWIPRKVDGNPNFSHKLTFLFSTGAKHDIAFPALPAYLQNWNRMIYYDGKSKVSSFVEEITKRRNHMVVLTTGNDLLSTTTQVHELLHPDLCSGVCVDLNEALPRDLQLDSDSVELNCKSPLLGVGVFGKVSTGSWRGMHVAVKSFHMQTDSDKNNFLKEVALMSTVAAVSHENIIRMHGYVSQPQWHIVLELADLGDLSQLLYFCTSEYLQAMLTDGRIKRNISLGIVKGMCQIHRLGIIHGDLKPQNILLSSDFVAKIADFGSSSLAAKRYGTNGNSRNFLCYGATVTTFGTAGYVAPELLTDLPEVQHSSKSSDVYAFGILLNELITEEEPFLESLMQFFNDPESGVRHIISGNRPRMNMELTPAELVELVKSCWETDNLARPSFEELVPKLAGITFVDSFGLCC